jgi:hypothetical protein
MNILFSMVAVVPILQNIIFETTIPFFSVKSHSSHSVFDLKKTFVNIELKVYLMIFKEKQYVILLYRIPGRLLRMCELAT